MDPFVFSPSELCQAIGRRAKDRRLALRIRQIDLAKQAGLSLMSLKRFENSGEGSFENVARIAFALRAEGEFTALFPPHDSRSLDDVLTANRTRKRARR